MKTRDAAAARSRGARTPTCGSSPPRSCSRVTATPASPWAAKASTLYDPAYARRYRAHDDEFEQSAAVPASSRTGCGRRAATFAPPIDVLDLGCGTGRYFWALDQRAHARRHRRVAGDAGGSAPSVQRRSHHGAARSTLVEGDLFDARRSAGAASISSTRSACSPSTRRSTPRVVAHVCALAEAGRPLRVHDRASGLAVGAADTSGAASAESLLPLAPAALASRSARRLLAGGLYADEARIARAAAPALQRSSRCARSSPRRTCTAGASRGRTAA